MHALRPSVAVLALVLAGCNAATPTRPTAPTASNTPATQNEAARDANVAPASANPEVSASQRQAVASPIQNGFDQLSGRLTLLQEQVLQLRSDSQSLMEQNRMLLNHMQVLNTPAGGDERRAVQSAADDASALEQVDTAIGQLMQVLNQMDMSDGESGRFAMATTYTRQGDWILLRYDRHSGETWLANGGRWQAVSDVSDLNTSFYRVLVHRADQDTKGYVAVRIDEQSGMAWWLNGNRWQEYEL